MELKLNTQTHFNAACPLPSKAEIFLTVGGAVYTCMTASGHEPR